MAVFPQLVVGHSNPAPSRWQSCCLLSTDGFSENTKNITKSSTDLEPALAPVWLKTGNSAFNKSWNYCKQTRDTEVSFNNCSLTDSWHWWFFYLTDKSDTDLQSDVLIEKQKLLDKQNKKNCIQSTKLSNTALCRDKKLIVVLSEQIRSSSHVKLSWHRQKSCF